MKKIAIGAIALGFGVTSFAQTISIGNFATGYSQNFDSLTTSTTAINLTNGGGEFNNGAGATLAGWYYGAAGASTIAADTGSGTSGKFCSFGSSGTPSDRALGALVTNGLGGVQYGARFVNNTNTSTGLAVIQFDLEEWRNNSNATKQGLTLTYKLIKAGGGGSFTQSDFNGGTGFTNANMWLQTTLTSDSSLTGLSSPTSDNTVLGPIATSSGGGALDGNLSANSVRVRAVVQLFADGQSWDQGDEIVFRFSDPNDTGNDHGLGIDNVKVVPEPASMAAIGLGIFGLISKRRRKA